MRILTNGYWDLFHLGHEYLLEKTIRYAGQGGIVLVALCLDNYFAPPKDNESKRTNNIIKKTYLYRKKYKTHLIIQSFDGKQELKRIIDNFTPDIITSGKLNIKNIIGSNKWPVCIVPKLNIEGIYSE